MARPKSIILSKDEKKAVVTDLKAQIKALKDNCKELAGIRKEADKALAAATKAHIASLKENDKAAGAAAKALAAVEAQLVAMTEPVAA